MRIGDTVNTEEFLNYEIGRDFLLNIFSKELNP